MSKKTLAYIIKRLNVVQEEIIAITKALTDLKAEEAKETDPNGGLHENDSGENIAMQELIKALETRAQEN